MGKTRPAIARDPAPRSGTKKRPATEELSPSSKRRKTAEMQPDIEEMETWLGEHDGAALEEFKYDAAKWMRDELFRRKGESEAKRKREEVSGSF